jgi:hypothetical protein
MADRVPFLVRLDPEVMAALKRWANDDLRSLNAEIEFLLRRALAQAHRLPAGGAASPASDEQGSIELDTGVDGGPARRADAGTGTPGTTAEP